MNDVRGEIKAVFLDWPIWVMLGTQDIKLRYRSSAIGPFWITIHMAVTICCMSFLYGHLFRAPLDLYLPYLTAGIISWAFLSTLIMEGSNAFVEAGSHLRNQDLFLSIFTMRLLLRNIIIFAHNLLVFIPIIFIFHIGISPNTLWLIPGLLLISVNSILWGTLLSLLTARFRDVTQIINSMIQIAFFLTPIMWMPNFLPEKYQWVIQINPFAQFINLIRSPLLNTSLSLQNLLIVSLITLLGFVLYTTFLSRYKNRIVFWL